MEKYSNLLSPIKVGPYTYRNRIEAAPTIFSTVALIPEFSDKVLRMLEDRAKGGCASVVNGEIPVNFDDSLRPIVTAKGKQIIKVNYTDFDDPAFAVFQKSAEVIKKHGAIAISELSHFGIEKPLLEDGIQPLGPVAFIKPDGTEVRAFDRGTMDKVTNDFVNAAAFMKAAGFQGLFLHYGHGWLIGQFLSKGINKRTDEYGGSIENRSRFPLEILRAIRERCGNNFIIEIRLSGEENMPSGITLEDTVGFCQLVDKEGLADLIHISAGYYFSPARTREFSTIFTPHGLNANNAAAVKKSVSIPVAVVGGITSPEIAEQIIAEGKADIVSMGRQMIADPDFANKAASGHGNEIRNCLRCCVCYPGPSGEHETDPVDGHLPKLGSCTINPYHVNTFSHHTVLPEDMPKPAASRKVLVVGGGPGGMQAAIDAADRGHQVILAENNDHLGGTLRLTDHDFFKKDLRDFKDYLVREVGKRDIEVRLGTHVTQESIREISPEALILAIGAEPLVPSIPGIQNAVTALDVYFNPAIEIGENVVMIGGGLVGCEVGLELAHMDKSVTVIEAMERLVANSIGIHRTALLDEMDEYGIRSLVNTRCIEVRPNGVLVAENDQKGMFIEADTVVMGLGMRPRRSECDTLRSAAGSIPVFEIGDCLQVAKVGEAVQQGYTAAMSII